MKRFVLFAMLMLAAAFAQAEVYKCRTTNGIVYSEHACSSGAEAVHVQANEPTDADAQAAHQRLLEDARANANDERQSQTTQQTWVYQQQYRTMPQMPQSPQMQMPQPPRVVIIPSTRSVSGTNSCTCDSNSHTSGSNSRATVPGGRTTSQTVGLH